MPQPDRVVLRGGCQISDRDGFILLTFYLSQHFYRAFEEDFEEGMTAIEKALRDTRFSGIVSMSELPLPKPALARRDQSGTNNLTH